MAHLFSYPTKHGPRLIDICRAAVCRAASLVSLASMIVASSVEFCTFSRPDAVGATCRPNMVRPPRSTIATTDGRSAGFGSACSSRLQLLAMFLANSASTVRM